MWAFLASPPPTRRSRVEGACLPKEEAKAEQHTFIVRVRASDI